MDLDKSVTVILTSSGRFDLLRITIESFLKHNTYDIKEFFVHDDSGYSEPSGYECSIPVDLQKEFPFIKWLRKEPIRIIKNQILSLDFLWSQVTTPYAMVLEDDWEFLRPGFIEDSMAVLEQDPNILMCWLQPLEEHNTHPIEWTNKGYGILKTQPNLWAGTRFNPALKRLSDYKYLGSYGAHTTFDRNKPWKAEADIAKKYWEAGFKGAMLKDRYIKHIGVNRHVK